MPTSPAMTALRLAPLYIEAAQERLPGPVDLLVRGPGAGGPQPYRVRVPLAGQVINLEPDEGALDDG